ncbi:O-antigen ligase family protein [Thermodesulfobacteriota bacterium]
MNKLPVYMLYLWTFVAIGRPQDVFPALMAIHPGDIAAGLSIITYIIWGEKTKKVLLYPEFKLFIAFFIIAAISTPLGVYPKWSLELITDFFLKIGILLYLVTQQVTTEDRIHGMLNTLVFSGVVMAVATIATTQEGIRASVGSTYDPNDMALLMVITLPLALTQALSTKKVIWKTVCFSGAVMCLIALIATQSRGGFMGLLVVGLFILFTKMPGLPKKKIVFASLVLALFFVIKMGSDYENRINTIFDDVSSLRAGSKRMLIWQRSLVIASDYPILGAGPYCFNTAYGYYLENDKFVGELSPVYDEWAAYKWATAHNSFLLVLVEMGIVGLAIFLAIIFKTFINLRKINEEFSNRSESISLALQSIGIKISLIGFLVCGFFLSQSYNIIPYLFCFLSGTILRNAKILSLEEA